MSNTQVSHWWEQVARPIPRPELPGSISADVAIVGAGYTGLWTAYYLKHLRPGLKVVVVEERYAGYGAAARNGGCLTNAVPGGSGQYVKRNGRQAAGRLQLALNDSVAEVLRVADAERIDADILRGGELRVAHTPAQEARLRALAEAEQRWPHTELEFLEAPAARERISVSGGRAAVWHPHAARIQPAKLVAGLARAVERLGVAVYERTRAVEILPGELLTTHGTVAADCIVRATEGFTAHLAGLHRLWLPLTASLIVTEPLGPEAWGEIGWERGEVLGDFSHAGMYAQRTADNRIVLGGGGGPYRFGSKTHAGVETRAATARALGTRLHGLFPATREAQTVHAWSGALAVPRGGAASVGLDRESGGAWAGGFGRTGLAAANLAGRTLADLILERDSELVTLPWVNQRVRQWAPEPVRWIATRGLAGATGAADAAEARGAPALSTIARLAGVVAHRGA